MFVTLCAAWRLNDFRVKTRVVLQISNMHRKRGLLLSPSTLRSKALKPYLGNFGG